MGWKVLFCNTTLDFNKHVTKTPVDYKCIDLSYPLVHKRV